MEAKRGQCINLTRKYSKQFQRIIEETSDSVMIQILTSVALDRTTNTYKDSDIEQEIKSRLRDVGNEQ